MKLKKMRYEPLYHQKCSNCQSELSFFRFSGMSNMFPHFYCGSDKCSNVYFDEKNRELVMQTEISEEILKKIKSTLPKCLCGENFLIDGIAKCPHCNFGLITYHTILERISDPHAILLDGAFLVMPVN